MCCQTKQGDKTKREYAREHGGEGLRRVSRVGGVLQVGRREAQKADWNINIVIHERRKTDELDCLIVRTDVG